MLLPPVTVAGLRSKRGGCKFKVEVPLKWVRFCSQRKKRFKSETGLCDTWHHDMRFQQALTLQTFLPVSASKWQKEMSHLSLNVQSWQNTAALNTSPLWAVPHADDQLQICPLVLGINYSLLSQSVWFGHSGRVHYPSDQGCDGYTNAHKCPLPVKFHSVTNHTVMIPILSLVYFDLSSSIPLPRLQPSVLFVISLQFQPPAHLFQMKPALITQG